MKPTTRNRPSVRVANEQSALPVSAAWVRRLAEAALRARGERLRLSVVLVDDRTLRRLHREFCKDDSATDVITFDLRGEKGTKKGTDLFSAAENRSVPFFAEVVISAERAKKEARRRGVSPEHELALYLVHGILHLGGYRDGTARERARMREAEKRLLRRLGLPHVF